MNPGPEQTSSAHFQSTRYRVHHSSDLITSSLNRPETQSQRSAPEGRDEGALVDIPALQAGDEAAWTAAFRHLWRTALGAARHPCACLTDGESEEAASEALAQLVSQITLVRTVQELEALVATIAFRRAISVARRKSAAKRGAVSLSLNDALFLDETLALHAPDSDGSTDVEAAEMALLLQQALSELDDETRALLEEKLVSGATYEELSAGHGIPLGTACAKVARGLKKVRRRLENSPVLAKELRAFLR
jgi:RNA polymerase sigma factor (sigma-70 family)